MTVSHRWHKPTIVGDLVTLRPMCSADADAAWEMVNDPEGTDLTATVATFTFEQISEWVSTRNEQDQRLDLAIVENATGEYVGEAVLNEYDAESDSANFRISLRGPAWFGRRLGGEATELVVRHGLGSIGLTSITLGVLARNPRARKAYERAGFQVVGQIEEDGEQWIDMAIHCDTVRILSAP
ncbi:MAG: GNAT family N-acetyltransferase [Ilumatobacteraceae bacterium]